MGDRQDPEAHVEPIICKIHDLWKRHGRHPHAQKTKLVLNKPVYTGMTILENREILMYDFFYNHLKAKYGENCELVYTDTDSLILDIQTEDVYKRHARRLMAV